MYMASGNPERFDEDESKAADYLSPANGVAGEYDFCSRSGAHELKAKIEAYWRARGHTVQVVLHNVGFHPAIRAARFDVRSDMINGMPRGAAKRAPAKVEACVEDFDRADDDLIFE